MTERATQRLALPARYEPITPLGKGGGGEVWAVRDRISGKKVALKVLAEGADEREVLALVREAVALSGVEGLGVPRVLRFGRLPSRAGGERAYMVRELVEGESLADLLARGGDPRVHLEAIAQAADQLTLLHRALLLHGDIKPANVIVSTDGRATLVDLGLAATWREGGARAEGLTPRYAAPELFEGAALTVRAEVFALGATLEETLQAARDAAPSRGALTDGVVAALERVVARATAEEPTARYPSVDELASDSLRRAAQLAEPASGMRGGAAAAWPILGLDGATTQLLSQIAALPRGGGIVVTGPRGSGRSALLRRIAWSLGVEGHAVAWIEAGTVRDASEAIAIELAAGETTDGAIVALVDDAEQLGDADLAKLDLVRKKGGKLVLVLGSDSAHRPMPGRTFEVFAIPALAREHAGELVRRTIPSLSDAVVEHVVERAGGWPGKIRAIVTKLAGAPVVGPADVDRLLGADESERRAADPKVIHELLDCGHIDEAAELLDTLRDDRSTTIAVARARVLTGRGDWPRALAELASVREAALADTPLFAATWCLHAARAHLRAGDYAEAEEHAGEVLSRLDPGAKAGASEPIAALPPEARALVADALAVAGLAQSFMSRHDDARGTLEKSVRTARGLGDARPLSVALGSLAFALQRNDRIAEAKAAYEEALGCAEQAGDAGSVATMRLNLSTIAQAQGDLAAAIRHLEATVDMGRRSGRMATVRQALLNLANLDLYLGRLSRARGSLDALAAMRAELGPQMAAQLLALEAEHAGRSGDLAAAMRLCRDCAEAYEAMGRRLDAAEARLERVLYGASRPDADPAELSAELARAEVSIAGTTAHRGLFALARGKASLVAGDEDAARAAFGEALVAARAAGQRDLIWRALEARAALEQRAGQPQKARRDRDEALGVLEEIAAKLPRDLREVYWNDARRAAVRSAAVGRRSEGAAFAPSESVLDITTGATVAFSPPSEDRLARVLEINREIAGEHDLHRLLERVTDHAIALLRAERGFVILRSHRTTPDGTSDLSIHASRDQAGDDPHARFSRSIAERVIQTGEPVVTSSAREDGRMADYVSVHQLMLQSVACVPIRARPGQSIGALYLETRLRPGATFAQELPTLVAFADQVAIAITTARLVGENERRAKELAKANEELEAARKKLEELLGHRTAQLAATRRDLRNTRAVLRSHFGYEGLVGTSEAMRRVYALIDRVKDTDVPVLIAGESGTGKEIVARAIHNAGPRSKRPFVGINCGAIPENLLESELFGHVRGAFTGADRDRKGLFREATEGTILLDEIGEMPHKMQAGLLRVLQEKVVRPVGGAREEPVDTRVIAATHRDLARMVEEGKFREDLFYRLNVIQVRVPPLRERIEDVPVLIDHFLGIFAARYSRERRSVSRAALKSLMGYRWPGNVRQLENVLLNAWVLSDTPELEPEDFELPSDVGRAPVQTAAPASPSGAPGGETSFDAHRANERERILAALASCNWNRVKAATLVGLPRRTFYRRLKEYGIQ